MEAKRERGGGGVTETRVAVGGGGWRVMGRGGWGGVDASHANTDHDHHVGRI